MLPCESTDLDLAPDTTCLIKGSDECVAGAQCQNTAAEGAPAEVVKCVCKEGFHKNATDGTPVCDAGQIVVCLVFV